MHCNNALSQLARPTTNGECYAVQDFLMALIYSISRPLQRAPNSVRTRAPSAKPIALRVSRQTSQNRVFGGQCGLLVGYRSCNLSFVGSLSIRRFAACFRSASGGCAQRALKPTPSIPKPWRQNISIPSDAFSYFRYSYLCSLCFGRISILITAGRIFSTMSSMARRPFQAQVCAHRIKE